MSKGMYIGVDNVARKIRTAYIGVDNVARKIKKAYIGVDNVAKCFFSSGLGLYAGGQGYFISSTEDGTEWTKTNKTTSSYTGTAMAYGNGTIVVVGINNAVYSKDGINWTSIPALSSTSINDIAFCKDRFVAVGYGGLIFYSFDGISWTSTTPFSTKICSICYNENDDIIAICKYNSDGTGATFAWCNRSDMTWTNCSQTVSIPAGWTPNNRCLAWNGRQYIMGLYSNVYYNTSSTMDHSWVSSLAMNQNLNRIVNLGSYGTAIVSDHGKCIIVDNNTIGIISSNTKDWSISDSSLNYVIKDIAKYQDEVYLCIRSGPAEIYKRDGDKWVSVLSINNSTSGDYVYFNYLCSAED